MLSILLANCAVAAYGSSSIPLLGSAPPPPPAPMPTQVFGYGYAFGDDMGKDVRVLWRGDSMCLICLILPPYTPACTVFPFPAFHIINPPVLQQAPSKAAVYGFVSNGGSGVKVTVSSGGKDLYTVDATMNSTHQPFGGAFGNR